MQNKKMTIVLSIIGVLKSIVVIAQAIFSKILIDKAVNKENLLFTSLIFLFLLLLLTFLILVGNLIKKRLLLQIEVGLKGKVFTSLINKDIKELRRFHSGEISNIYLNDINNIMIGEADTIPSIFLLSSRFILALIVLIIFDYRLLLVLIVFGVFILLGARFYSRYMKKYSKLSIESDGSVNAFMQESYENIKFLKAMNTETAVQKKLKDKLAYNQLYKNKKYNASVVGSTGMATIINLSLALVIVYGAFEIKNNPLFTYGTLLSLSQIVSYFETPISSLSSIVTKMASYNVSKKRINSLFELKEDFVQEDVSSFNRIIIDDISFSYDKPLYDGFSFIINKNDKVIIKGPSGSGKSTLFNLILGFEEPNKGSINIEVDGKMIPSKNARNLFSYVSQENILFSGTIRENISLFVDNCSEEEIVEALKDACVYDEIMQKEDGLNTRLNERGNGLSQGQIQRILLAICLLKKKPILLLDEFTSSLDIALEKQIVNNLMKKESTMIIITHRNIDVIDAKEIILNEI